MRNFLGVLFDFLIELWSFHYDYKKRNDKIIKIYQQILDNISTLSEAKSRSIQVRDTLVEGGIRTTISTAELRLAQNRIEVEEKNEICEYNDC